MVNLFHDLVGIVTIVGDYVFQVRVGLKIGLFKSESDTVFNNPADPAGEVDIYLG